MLTKADPARPSSTRMPRALMSAEVLAAKNAWFVLEISHGSEPKAFHCFGRDGFLQHYRNIGSEGVIYEALTPRKLAASEGCTSANIEAAARRLEEVDRDDYLTRVIELATRFGWDTKIYRADYLTGFEEYRRQPIDEIAAVSAFAAHSLSAWHLVTNPAECRDLISRLESTNARNDKAAATALRKATTFFGSAFLPPDERPPAPNRDADPTARLLTPKDVGSRKAPDRDPGARLLTLKDVVACVAMGRSTIYRQMAAGNFPAPLSTVGSVRWLESDVQAWIAALPTRGYGGSTQPDE